MLLIQHAQIATPLYTSADGWLLCSGGQIAAIGTGTPPQAEQQLDAGGLLLLPGGVDVHIHGGANADTMDATRDALAAISLFCARHGTTSFLATTWSDTRERITAALHAVKAVLASGTPLPGAHLLGVHLEGPYLNRAKGGAQNLEVIRRADREEALSWLNTGVIRLVSVAPEYPENHWLITECLQRGIAVSIAHTDANYAQTCQAIDLGINHSTHTFNAMPGLHHRDPGVLGAVLNDPRVFCEVIADTIHVHPAILQLLWRLKGAERLILVTDAMRAADQPDGAYPVDDRIVTVCDGIARLPDGTLAGSTLTMARAAANLRAATGAPLEQIWQCASLNPARSIHCAQRKGTLEVGKDADLILMDPVSAQVQTTIVAGRIVH